VRTLGDIALSVAGCALIVAVLDAELRTFVLPRGAVVRLNRVISVLVRRGFDVLVTLARTYEGRDRVMALYAPITLFAWVVVWMVMILTGYTLLFRAIDGGGWHRALVIAGSSTLTLGFDHPPGFGPTVLAFAAAATGLAVLALLIAYLPTLYGSFSRREVLVAHLSARAGTPPRPVDLLVRARNIGPLTDLNDVWVQWQLWFAEIEETHTSMALLNFFRSPDPARSWITAAGAVLDTASLVNSTVDTPSQPMAALCVRSGYGALRSIADFFGIPHDPDPSPTDPITIARDEWEAVCAELAAAGVPLRADREQAWRDFAGWRVNYDRVLVTLAGFLVAPYSPWSSDRSVAYRVRLIRLRSRRPSKDRPQA
jgi:hypothetical protein